MSKQEQVLKINPPNELEFRGPFSQPVSSVMYLTNPSDRKVCFKIKTTAPKKYCVKPNSGVIDPDEKVKISVSLQPFDFVPQEKNKHKFMVQSMYAPEGEFHQDLLWKEVDSSQLMDSKLKCVFVMPENGNVSDPAASSEFPSAPPAVAAPMSVPTSHLQPESTTAVAPNTNQNSSVASGKVSVPQGDILLAEEANKKSTEEIKKLQEEMSALRQENIQLREEALRQARLASRVGGGGGADSSSDAAAAGFSVSAVNPDANALSVNYLYMALFILVVGIIMGKVIF